MKIEEAVKIIKEMLVDFPDKDIHSNPNKKYEALQTLLAFCSQDAEINVVEIGKFIVKFIAGKDCSIRDFQSRIVGKDELYELASALTAHLAHKCGECREGR